MIWNFCIERPILTIVVFLVVGIFGVYGYNQMAIREQPDVEFPIVNVNVVLPGAEPEVIETEVVEPLEEEINTTEGIKTIESTARPEVGTIKVEFELWRNVDIAAQDVRDRVNRARRELPDDVESPIIRKLDPDAQAIMWFAVLGNERWSKVEISNYVDRYVKPRLESIRGVGRVQIGGNKKYAVRVKLDPQKLAAHRVTVRDVVQTIRQQNVDIPSGRVTGKQREFLVKTEGQFNGAEPFNGLIVAHRNGSPVRLRDVGRAVDGVENERTLARFSGEPTVGLGIVKQTDANTVRLADAVRSRMKKISNDLPPGLRYELSTDNSTYVRENIISLRNTILIATLLVVLVILFFLQSWRGTIISSIAIPTSLATGMALIFSFGFSLNVLTMLSFILVIGIVVDDAIVILESCYRHMEEGAERMAATRVGTTEIAFATIANTLSMAAVFIPVAFTRGIVGRFFFQFGVTTAVTIFASTLTALTLTPVMCSRLLTVSERESWLSQVVEGFLSSLEQLYSFVLDWSLRHRFVVILVAVFALVTGILAFTGLNREFAPSVDRGEFMISFETPEGSTLQATNDYATKIEKTLKKVPEIKRFFLAVGLSQGGGPGQVNNGISFVHMSHRTKRERTHLQVMQDVRERLKKFPGGRAYVLEISPGAQQGAPVQVVLQSQDLNTLARKKNEILAWMRKQPEFVGSNSNLKMRKPQVEVRVNRDKASEMGITVAGVSNTMRFLLGEPDVSEIERQAERHKVITDIAGDNERVPSVLRDLYVRSSSGKLVALSNVAEIKETIGPSEIHHFNRLRSVTLSASTPPDVTMGQALGKLQGHLAETLPSGFNWETTGQAQDMQESFYYLTISLVFAIIFVYLVLSAQFESWVHPFTIMTALPLAATGAFGVLYLFDMTFNVFVFIGTIMLVGLVTKNGILLIDYANVLADRGQEVMDAAREAGMIRFRPVLMTAVSTILGMMPIALGYGAGGEARAPMGWTIATGMFTATVLTLLVVPVVYTLVDDFTSWFFENTWSALRLGLALGLLGTGLWMGWITYQLPVEGTNLLVLLVPVLFLFLVSLGSIMRFRGSGLGLFLAVCLFALLGVIFLWSPGMISKYVNGLDPARTGTGLIGVAVIALVLWFVSQFINERD